MSVHEEKQRSAFRHRWDLLTNQYPFLPNLVFYSIIILGGIFVFKVMPTVMIEKNERRPAPVVYHDDFLPMPEYVEEAQAPAVQTPADAAPEKRGLFSRFGRGRVVDDPALKTVRDDVPRVVIPPKVEPKPSSSQPRRVYVSVIDTRPEDGAKLILNAGRYVDLMDLRLIDRYVQEVTLKSPVAGFEDIVDLPLDIEVMRHQLTRCKYYQVALFGAVRLVEAPEQERLAKCY